MGNAYVSPGLKASMDDDDEDVSSKKYKKIVF